MSPLALPLLSLVLAFRVDLITPPDAPPDFALSWRAWSPGLALQAEPATAAEQVGAEAPRRLSCELPAEGGGWTLLVHGESGGDTWFAVAVGERAHEVPLLRVPVPVAVVAPEDGGDGGAGAVALEWTLEDGVVPGLAGWQVLRATDGGEQRLVGEVRASATRFVDAPPAGEHAWALRPVLTEGMTGPAGSFSHAAVVGPETPLSPPPGADTE